MSRAVKVKVYKFEELSEKVQEHLIQLRREFYHESGDISEEVTDHFKNRLSELGFPYDAVEWSLGYCQGDGMAFYGGPIASETVHRVIREYYARTGKEAKINPLMSITKTWLQNAVQFTIGRTSYASHYSHYNTMQVEVDMLESYSDKQWQATCAIRDLLAEEIKDLSKTLEREGYEIIEGYDEDYARRDLIEQDEEYYSDGRTYSD